MLSSQSQQQLQSEVQAKEQILKQQQAKIEHKAEAQKQILDTKALNQVLERKVEEVRVRSGNVELAADRQAHLLSLEKRELTRTESVLAECLRIETELKSGFVSRKE